MKKTNAARILDRLKIDYELKEYKVDLNDLSAIHVAKDVNMDIIMACIPGDDELHLKKLAQVANFKKVEMIHLKELLPLTGYVRGGCSPLGAKKAYPVFIDETALKWPKIAISAGVRGEQILLAPQDLIKAVNATVADLIK